MEINSQKTLAARHKGFHAVNMQPALMFIAKICIKQMPQKLRDRLRFYSSFDELEVMEKEMFPIECGGETPMKELTGGFKSFWKLILTSLVEPRRSGHESRKILIYLNILQNRGRKSWRIEKILCWVVATWK